MSYKWCVFAASLKFVINNKRFTNLQNYKTAQLLNAIKKRISFLPAKKSLNG